MQNKKLFKYAFYFSKGGQQPTKVRETEFYHADQTDALDEVGAHRPECYTNTHLWSVGEGIEIEEKKEISLKQLEEAWDDIAIHSITPYKAKESVASKEFAKKLGF